MRITVGAGILLAGALGCGEQAGRLGGPVHAHPELVVGQGITASDPERAALGRVARFLAIALNENGMRQRLKNHLRASPFKEHKVELATYLRRPDAEVILGKMAAVAGQTKSEILTAVSQIRSVELYMPVPKQRETWDGDTDVLVAAQLVEHDPIMGFNGRGEAVPMDESGPPTQPTLSIVGAETRFDQPMSPLTSRNTNDQNGKTIGTLVPADLKASKMMICDDACSGGGGGGGTPSLTRGLYLEFSRILDAKEPWERGDPEVEVHIHGPTDANEPNVLDDRSCSGEHPIDSRKYFDQNDGFWSGQVLLMTWEEFGGMPDTLDYHIIFWEDDNTACILKIDSPVVRNYLLMTLRAMGSAATKIKYGLPVAAVAFVGAIYNSAGNWMLTNDDFIGDAVWSLPLHPYWYEENTHVIVDEGLLNGRANIVWRP